MNYQPWKKHLDSFTGRLCVLHNVCHYVHYVHEADAESGLYTCVCISCTRTWTPQVGSVESGGEGTVDWALRRGSRKAWQKKRKCDGERERGNQAGDKSVGSNIAELKVTWVLISCQWKREQYQDWNTSFNESLVQGAQWAQAVNIQNIIPPSLTLSAPCSSTLCYCIGAHTHTHAHRPAHTRINAATYMCPH